MALPITEGRESISEQCKRIPQICGAEQSQLVVAQTFNVSVSTIKRYLKQRREVEHVLSKAIPGRPSIKGADLQAGFLDQLRANPDAT